MTSSRLFFAAGFLSGSSAFIGYFLANRGNNVNIRTEDSNKDNKSKVNHVAKAAKEFDDAPKISVTNADDFFQGSDDNPMGMEREHQTEGEANNILPRVC